MAGEFGALFTGCALVQLVFVCAFAARCPQVVLIDFRRSLGYNTGANDKCHSNVVNPAVEIVF